MPVLSPALAQPAAEAWRWWIAELRAMVPDDLAARVRRQPPAWSDIELTRDAITIERVRGGTGERLADERPIEALDEEGWAELAELVEGSRTRIILSPPDVFAATISLPAAARRRMRSAVALQLDQIAPLEPALLSWNSEVLDAGRQGISVLVAMARTDRIAGLESLFAEHGLPAPPIFARAGDRLVKLASGFDASRRAPESRDRRAWLFAALLLGSIPFTVWAGASLLAGITQSRIAAVQREIAPQLAQERKAQADEALRRALKPMLTGPSATQAIESLALAMPDTAYATELAKGPDGKLTFSIEASDTDALAAAMTEAPLLADAAPSDMVESENGRMRVYYAGAGT